ncbi:unnamed protein product [Fraxinus pennsylvanica]|uniref:Protein kinase domain-containing protein n=1 Tax=Fraxinus pennsylvanica TaxID=56036 RepID=A0AAD1ZTW4_9LAMI|nr:unnamed protein product [Fraxinus pennsylvanica]
MIAVITTELGDASITSSFVAKRTSVASITYIIRQGRSNLVINLQMLKIIFLQTAYLSVMYLYGMKETSIQATIHVVSATAFFQFMQHALPLGTLSAERPHSNKLCTYVFLSVLGQFGVHLLVLISCVKDAENYIPDEFIEQEDSPMTHEDLNDWLKLVPLSIALRDKLEMWAFLMFLCCNLWERLLRWWAFSRFCPAGIGGDGLSRYRTDFHEIEQIGSGNFSRVFKVLKRLDGCMYAVKHSLKRLHQDTERSKALMEVQALASLGLPAHPFLLE